MPAAANSLGKKCAEQPFETDVFSSQDARMSLYDPYSPGLTAMQRAELDRQREFVALLRHLEVK